MKFELCTDSLEGVIAAQELGCNRVELCAALSIGGITPSFGMVKQCVERGNIEIHAMIRPREGDFVYTEEEIEVMEYNIKQFALLGVKGVVFGVLNSNSTVADTNKHLCELAKSYQLEVTFHRAFDFLIDPNSGIEKIISIGFDRILSSGLSDTAEKGLAVLEMLQLNYGEKIQIMAGSGVNAGNVSKFIHTGIQQIHFTARKPISDSSQLEMGIKMEVDKTKIQRIMSSIN